MDALLEAKVKEIQKKFWKQVRRISPDTSPEDVRGLLSDRFFVILSESLGEADELVAVLPLIVKSDFPKTIDTGQIVGKSGQQLLHFVATHILGQLAFLSDPVMAYLLDDFFGSGFGKD